MREVSVILITGATAGIGRHAALELARRGHHVIAAGRRIERLEDLVREAEREGVSGRVDALRLDVTSPDDVTDAVPRVDHLTRGHGVDVLVNNAGYGQVGPLESISDGDLRRQFETNVFGLMAVTRAFVPQMRERRAGRIVNVGSVGGRFTFPFMGAYTATKYAVESLSDALRYELRPFGIEVSIVEPGPIRTEFNDRAMETLADGTESPYAPVFADAERLRARFERGGAGPDVTTRAIVHAALSSRPKVRYVVPPSAALLLRVLRALPTRWADAIVRAASGLTPAKLLV